MTTSIARPQASDQVAGLSSTINLPTTLKSHFLSLSLLRHSWNIEIIGLKARTPLQWMQHTNVVLEVISVASTALFCEGTIIPPLNLFLRSSRCAVI